MSGKKSANSASAPREGLDEDEYVVERILDKKWIKERKRYEVRTKRSNYDRSNFRLKGLRVNLPTSVIFYKVIQKNEVKKYLNYVLIT